MHFALLSSFNHVVNWFVMFYDQMAFHKREFEPNSLTFNLSWPSNEVSMPIALNCFFFGMKNHKREMV
jgi:hypothetical protein